MNRQARNVVAAVVIGGFFGGALYVGATAVGDSSEEESGFTTDSLREETGLTVGDGKEPTALEDFVSPEKMIELGGSPSEDSEFALSVEGDRPTLTTRALGNTSESDANVATNESDSSSATRPASPTATPAANSLTTNTTQPSSTATVTTARAQTTTTTPRTTPAPTTARATTSTTVAATRPPTRLDLATSSKSIEDAIVREVNALRANPNKREEPLPPCITERFFQIRLDSSGKPLPVPALTYSSSTSDRFSRPYAREMMVSERFIYRNITEQRANLGVSHAEELHAMRSGTSNIASAVGSFWTNASGNLDYLYCTAISPRFSAIGMGHYSAPNSSDRSQTGNWVLANLYAP